MDTIVLLGLNHKTAPVEIRECLAFTDEESQTAIESYKKSGICSEVVLISTCNRVELIMVTSQIETAITEAKTFISKVKNIPILDFDSSLYQYIGDDAVRHIFRVSASLDSMMVGEPQILGQIKEAYHLATELKTTGAILNRLLHRAFFVAKRVRTETGIGDHAVSISYAAIELGKKIFETFEDKKALLIGAGEMAELAVEHLIRNRCKQIFVANRTFARGVELARKFNGNAISFDEIINTLTVVDIIISSTGAQRYVIQKDQVKPIMRRRKNRPLFFIDIAVPRNIDPAINRIENTYVYDIDDLKGVIADNLDQRNNEAIKGERIVDEAVLKFHSWYASLDIIPTIKALRAKINTLARSEVEKTIKGRKHLTDDDIAAFHKMTNALVNKILHHPTLFLKSDGCYQDKSYYLDTTRKLFNLDDQ